MSDSYCDEHLDPEALKRFVRDVAANVIADREQVARNMVLHASTPPGLLFTFHGSACTSSKAPSAQ